jgi:hypothetical protein
MVRRGGKTPLRARDGFAAREARGLQGAANLGPAARDGEALLLAYGRRRRLPVRPRASLLGLGQGGLRAEVAVGYPSAAAAGPDLQPAPWSRQAALVEPRFLESWGGLWEDRQVESCRRVMGRSLNLASGTPPQPLNLVPRRTPRQLPLGNPARRPFRSCWPDHPQDSCHLETPHAAPFAAAALLSHPGALHAKGRPFRSCWPGEGRAPLAAGGESLRKGLQAMRKKAAR